MLGCLPSFSLLSLNCQGDLLIFMILDDLLSPILQMTDFLRAKKLIDYQPVGGYPDAHTAVLLRWGDQWDPRV